MNTDEIPRPEFDLRAYGVALASFGEGGYIAPGHIEGRRFIAACNNYARAWFGLRNMVDDRHVPAAAVLADIRRGWVVPADPAEYHHEFEWAVKWVTEETPGALAMTVWEP